MQPGKFKIALFGNIHQERKSVAVQKFLALATEMKVELLIPATFLTFLTDNLQIAVPPCRIIDDIHGEPLDADIVVCMGGDGTFLDVASRVGARQIPIVGVNTGRLGFLANFSPDELEQVMQQLVKGKYTVADHSVIQLTCDEQTLEGYPYALNEIAILKHDISAMISIHTSVNGEYLTTYQADGLIVGTPTGSTAYSLSVGGPVITPCLDTISLTPVAPHSLNMRPILVDDRSVIDLCVDSRSGSFLVSLDGRSHSYRDHIHLHIRKAPYCVRVVTNPRHTFLSTLRQKMMWGADLRQGSSNAH